MNMHAPLSVHSAAEAQCYPVLADFARVAPYRHVRLRSAGIGGVLAVHALLLVAYFFASPAFVRAAPQRLLTVVNVLAEPPKPLDPPPLPKLAPPDAYVPVPIMPEVQLAVPPPPRETITIPPAPAIASPPDAPFGPATPLAPAQKPALSANAQAAFAARLFAHLNRFKRYPDGAKLRHQEGVVSLRFTMDRNGKVLSFDIAKSSGSAALDAEARDLIQRAQPLPPLPAEFGHDSLDLVVPVEFFLH
ncbi:MAG TPA: energy transducer TonB [Micropepsaceae bacterium]|nr:energy transducer TonB [Micropepsaceae bacterium]